MLVFFTSNIVFRLEAAQRGERMQCTYSFTLIQKKEEEEECSY
jgi:hypothetical protein